MRDKDEAIYKINQMYPEQVYRILTTAHPSSQSKKLLAESGCSSEEIPCKTIISEIKYHARKTFLSGIIFYKVRLSLVEFFKIRSFIDVLVINHSNTPTFHFFEFNC